MDQPTSNIICLCAGIAVGVMVTMRYTYDTIKAWKKENHINKLLKRCLGWEALHCSRIETTIHGTQFHEIKCWLPHFEGVRKGEKPFEIRINDRNYKKGDYLILKEYDQNKKELTGREVIRKVRYILDLHDGLYLGFVIMGLSNETYIIKDNPKYQAEEYLNKIYKVNY